MGLCLGAARELSEWSGWPETAIGEPSTKHWVETVRLSAFAPPGSRLDRQVAWFFPLTMSSPGGCERRLADVRV